MIFHFHKWAPWSQPILTGNGGHKQQWRVCAACNKAELRTLKWDGQSKVEEVNNACIESFNSQKRPPGYMPHPTLKELEVTRLLGALKAIAVCDMSQWAPEFQNANDFKTWAQTNARTAFFNATGESAC